MKQKKIGSVDDETTATQKEPEARQTSDVVKVDNSTDTQKQNTDSSRLLDEALHLDPDVIEVGEMRDPESAAAVKAALPNHTVTASLHTKNEKAAKDAIGNMKGDLPKPNLWPHECQAVGIALVAMVVGFLAEYFLGGITSHEVFPAALCAGFFEALAYASWVDIKTHYVSNGIPVLIAVIGLLSMFVKSANGSLSFTLPSLATAFDMLCGAVLTVAPFLFAALRSKKKGEQGIGGGDILLAASFGFTLGLFRGYCALLIGLAVALVCEGILILMKRKDKKSPFALVPYLAMGCCIAYFL